jgi:hypothetical protein
MASVRRICAVSGFERDPAFEEELVGVSVVREDLRQLLLAAQLYYDAAPERGEPYNERLALAIRRVTATASSPEWQPKPRRPTSPSGHRRRRWRCSLQRGLWR